MGIGRRRLLGAAAAGAAALVAEGCGPGGSLGASGSGASTPQRTGGAVQIVFAPNWQAPWNTTAQQLVQQMIDSQFAATHPGIAVKVVASTQGHAQAQIAASLAGTGVVDVFNDCCADLPAWAGSGLLLPLDARIRSANLDLTQWSRLRMQGLNFFGHQLAFPAYDGPEVMVYREDMLDTFGLPYPEPGWDYKTAASLWTQCARKVKGKPVYGVSLDTYWINADYLFHGWGTSMFSPDRTKCQIDSTACIDAGNWFFGLISDGVASPTRDQIGGLTSGRDVFAVTGGWSTYSEATALGTAFKWNILPQPSWSAGAATMVNSDFYAINAATHHPDEAWTLFQWLVSQPAWTRFLMQATLITPALISLWPQWTTLVQQAAPPLAGKHLEYYRDAALGGYEVPQSFFLYQGQQAASIMQKWWTQIIAKQVDVSQAFAQIASEINSLEQAAVTQAARQKASAGQFPTNGSPIAAVPTGI